MAEREVQRRLAAILAADVAGYTRLMEEDTDGTVAAWQAARADVIRPQSISHSGKLVKLTGDGFLIEFPTVQDAVKCAISIQQELTSSTLDFRIGVHMGDIVDDGEDIHGEGVNVAARLEGLADAGGICISGSVHEQVRNRIDVTYEDLGDKQVKNVSAPVRVYAIRLDGTDAPAASETALPDKPSIAVLPFDNLSGEPEQDYFSDGMAEDLITDLSKISNLSVAARNSSFFFKGQRLDVREVAKKLGVAYILEGSVRKMGDRLRVNAQLIDADAGDHLWAERYDGEMAEIFDFQDRIRAEIISALELKLTPKDIAHGKRNPTDSVEAHDLFLRGRASYHSFTPESAFEARKCLETAIEIDPNFADAYGYLSYCHFYGWALMWPGFDNNLDRANELAEKGVALDGTSAIALTRLGWIQTFLRRYDQAIANLEKAIALAPNNADVNATFGQVLNYWGNPERGLQLNEKAFSIEMLVPPNWEWYVGVSYLMLKQYDEALAGLNRAIERAPNFTSAYLYSAWAYVELDQLDDANNAIKMVLETSPRYTLKEVARIVPIRDDKVRDRFFNSLRKAGLPEHAPARSGADTTFDAPTAAADKPSIAVLPFDNLSDDPEQEYFSDGITEDIITALSGISRLHVTARNSTFSYKGQSPDIRDVAKDLDVRYVLEGSVRKAGNKVRITTQLIDGVSGNHLWAEHYDRDLEDIFAVQDEITETVIGAIQPEMSRAEMERARAKHPDNLDAWDLYQRGMFHQYRLMKGDVETAVDLFRQSIELAPELASAHAGLAYALSFLSRDAMSPEWLDEAIRAGNKAIDLDSDDPAGYVCLGSALTIGAALSDGNYDEAISTLEQGFSLGPTSAIGHAELGGALALAGRSGEAIDHLLTSIRLSPRDLNMGRKTSVLAYAYFANGDYEATVEWTTKTRRSRTVLLWLPFAVRVAALAYLGRDAEARAELEAFLEQYPRVRDSLKNFHVPFRDDVINGLRKAGLEAD